MSRRGQIVMTPDEIGEFLDGRHTMTLATIGPDGAPHLVAMWYGLLDGDVVFWSYRRAQKVKNLERDPRITVMVEDGEEYSELRGVSITGRAEVIDDSDTVLAVGASIARRYTGGSSEAATRSAAATAPKRIAIRVRAERTTSWDHRKLAGGY